MSDPPEWVPVDEVVALNKRIVEYTSEPFGLTDPGALESAVNRPAQHFHWDQTDDFDDVTLMGVKLCVGISEAQAFRQGNKRTGFAAMEMFFNLNGYEISDGAHGHIADLILASAHPDRDIRLSEDDFADALEPYVVEHDGDFLSGGEMSLAGVHAISMRLGEAARVDPSGEPNKAAAAIAAYASMPINTLSIGSLVPLTLDGQNGYRLIQPGQPDDE